jgi:hypothetical protein
MLQHPAAMPLVLTLGVCTLMAVGDALVVWARSWLRFVWQSGCAVRCKLGPTQWC